jgi:hypothetical protein
MKASESVKFFGKPNLAMLALAVLALASSPAQAQGSGEARVIKIMGHAEIMRAGTWRTARAGDVLRAGETLKAAEGGGAIVSAADGRIEVEVRGNAAIANDGLVDASAEPWSDDYRPAALGGVDPKAVKAPQWTVPEGEVEVNVVPGQPLRVLTPLVMAAVRGTKFLVSVALDGSSSLSVAEGQILAVARTGAAQMLGPGGGFTLSSGQFAAFLQESGLTVPGGDWHLADVGSLDGAQASGVADAANPAIGQSAQEATGASSASASSASSTTASPASATTTSATSTAASPASASSASTTAATASSTATPAATTTSAAATTATSTSAASAAASVAAQVAPVAAPIGAMAGAGVDSGALTRQEAEIHSGPAGILCGDGALVVDPVTGQPLTAAATDHSGQLAITVQPTPGQSKVCLAIGGEDYYVDVGQAAGGGSLEVEFDIVDFSDPFGQLISTATLRPNFDGLTPTAPVSWEIVGVVNPTGEEWWKRNPNDLHGLSWDPNLSGYLYWDSLPVIGGNPPPATALPVRTLSDVVGQRVVKVKAETTIDGVLRTRILTVPFGPGPLSVFGRLIETSTKFATNHDYVPFFQFLADNQTDFPAAYACGGSMPISSVNFTPPDNIIFNAPDWDNIQYGFSISTYYAKKTRLPTIDQLIAIDIEQTIGLRNYNGKLAGMAAGLGPCSINSGSLWLDNLLNRVYMYVITVNYLNAGVNTVDTGGYILCLK